MKKIDFEAHFFAPEQLKALSENEGYPRLEKNADGPGSYLWHNPDIGQPYGQPLIDALTGLDQGRVARMDACGVDVQILSVTTPSIDQLPAEMGTPLATASNNSLAQAIKKYPKRLKGYAVVAPKAPEAAADELERAVTELGFVGLNTHSNIAGAYLDEARFLPIFKRAEKLKVPIYLHPAVPAISQVSTYGFVLAGAPFGFGMETALTMMRLIYSGIFDKCPELKIILGHLGEGLPFIFERINWAWERPFDPAARPVLAKKPSDYLKENVFVTTSGNYYEPAFRCTREALGIDRILLGTDYPYEDSKECIDFIESLPISEAEKELVYFKNAVQLGFEI